LGIGGKLAETVLGASGITVNKNLVPYDERKPDDPSGIRVGTPALTSRGMSEDEMRVVARWMLEALRAPEDATVHERIRGEVRDLCTQFPVPAAALTEAETASVR
jgi:glycine hydroxymethyltransferase